MGLDVQFDKKGKEEFKNTLESPIAMDYVSLEEDKGNLRKLELEYSTNTAITSCPVIKQKSSGKTADAALVKTTEQISELSKALYDLLDQTCIFLEKVGVAFETVDQEAANALKK